MSPKTPSSKKSSACGSGDQGVAPPGPPVGGAAPSRGSAPAPRQRALPFGIPFVGLCPTPRQGRRPCTPQGSSTLDPSPQAQGLGGLFVCRILLCLLFGQATTEGTPKGSRGRSESLLVVPANRRNSSRTRSSTIVPACGAPSPHTDSIGATPKRAAPARRLRVSQLNNPHKTGGKGGVQRGCLRVG